MTTQQPKGWRDELKEKYVDFATTKDGLEHLYVRDWHLPASVQDIESFIESLLQEDRKERADELRKKIEEYFKGLILIPDPQATKENLLSLISE